MKPDINEWNIVIVGQWNPHIFSPKWMCEALLGVKDIESEFAVGPMTGGMRYLTNHLIILPGQDRLIIGPRNTSDSTLKEAENIAVRTLQLLQYTPVQAAGINFSFTESNPPPEVLTPFQLADNNILADAGYSLSNTEIIRDIKLDQTILKLKMAHSDKGRLQLHFNFHHSLESASQAATVIKDKTLEYRDRAINLLVNSYHLTMDEEDNNGSGNPKNGK